MSKVLIDRATVEQALEALEMESNPTAVVEVAAGRWELKSDLAIAALRAALAEPVQEPDSPERRCGGPGCDMTCCQPVQEPVAFKDAPERIWLQVCDDDHCEVPFRDHAEITWCAEQQNPLDVQYVRADLAAPPQRKPLTDEEIERLWYPSAVIAEPGKRRVAFGRAVERAHGIGGEG